MSLFAPDNHGSMYALKKAGIRPLTTTPEAGFYEIMTRHGWRPVRIWHGAPIDPVTLEEMDRSHQWNAMIDCSYADAYDIWPSCCARPISRAVYFDLVTLTPVENEFPVSMSNDETEKG